MKKYVVGFCFDCCQDYVLLVRKNRPDWQAGLFNGLGGKIKDGETPQEAMVREFSEETAGQGPVDLVWMAYARLRGRDPRGDEFEAWFFCSQVRKKLWSDLSYLDGMEVGGEVLSWVSMYVIGNYLVVSDLRYLVPMAKNHLSGFDEAHFFDISELAGEPALRANRRGEGPRVGYRPPRDEEEPRRLTFDEICGEPDAK